MFKKLFKGKKKPQKDRRKNLKLRAVIDANKKAAEDVVKVAQEFTATLNGDPYWLRRELLKEQDDGHSINHISDNSY